MGRIIAIALTTFRDCTRDAVFYVALVVFTGLLFLSGWMPFFGLGREAAMVRETGLATIAVGGLFLLLISGTGTVAAEFRSGTLQTVLSKPAGRNRLVLGKFFGIMLLLLLATAILTAMFLVMLALREGASPFELRGGEAESFGWRALKAAFLVFLELSLAGGFAVFMSALFPRPAAAVITLAAFTLGHLSQGAAEWLKEAGGAGRVLAALVPRLEFFRVTQAAVDGRPFIGADYVLIAVGYAAAGAAIFLLAAMMVVARREIK